MIPIEIQDLADAYRKVKVDLFYSGNPCRQKLLDFEDNLAENLVKILNSLLTYDKGYLFDISEGYWLCPKKIDFRDEKKNAPIFSDLAKAYSPDNVTQIDLRIIENLPIAFHIVMTLWINKIGERFDQKISSNSYGNRIRRHSDKTPNLQALGSFNPYLYPYQKWRDNGLETIRISLKQNKKVIAITGDFTAFYHNINADFMLSDKFQEKIGVILENEEKEFTRLIIDMLNHWADKTPLKRGLPVGCAISAVIANAALFLFDDQIEKEIVPLYYGRYVDDIILVLENTNDFVNSKDVWTWITKRVLSLSIKPNDGSTSVGMSNSKKSEDSRIFFELNKQLGLPSEENRKNELYFENNKTKIFLLDSSSGLAFLNSLEHQIKERSSEWRSLPELPDDEYIASMLLSTCNKTGEDADNLRKADTLSIRRAMFAMKLRDFESYSRNLPPASWEKQRKAFLETIDLHFTNLRSFFDLFRYFPRILSIAMGGSDYEYVISIVKKINENCQNILKKGCFVAGIKITPEKSELLLDFINSSFSESIIASMVYPIPPKFNLLLQKCPWLKIATSADEVLKKHRVFFGYDLANKPFRCFYLYKEANWFCGQRGTGSSFSYSQYDDKCNSFVRQHDFRCLLLLSKSCIEKIKDGELPRAWIFPTRPFSMPELYLCLKKPFIHHRFISKTLCILRGYAMQADEMPYQYCISDHYPSQGTILKIQNSKLSSEVNIALASWKTKESSWNAAACGKNDPDLSRYYRLSHLLNHILRSHKKVNYVIFPELSIPIRWFLNVANKLKGAGISLIAGVEYIHHPQNNNVYNQVWCSLVHNGLGFTQTVIIKHDKDIPAIHEQAELEKNAGVRLIPENPGQTCNIIQHGDFYFGILICSELTNIDYRAKLRGLVDAVFVPEWNPDIEMFSSLIEAAAYDIHAYIVQCNDRQYGDTRIRIPAKDHYSRDIVKVKGGEEDFYVIGKLNIDVLRKFQSFHISPIGKDALFKPVPAGFSIAPYRKTLPSGGEE